MIGECTIPGREGKVGGETTEGRSNERTDGWKRKEARKEGRKREGWKAEIRRQDRQEGRKGRSSQEGKDNEGG